MNRHSPLGFSLLMVTVAACGLLLAGCSEESSPGIEVPAFEDQDLQRGRAVWMQVCRNCHLRGVAGAPAISDPDAWASRSEKSRDVLHASAIEGIRADGGGWSMPPRGGNDTLADEDVRRAVDFMLAAVEELRP